jgi:hypothetical protein
MGSSPTPKKPRPHNAQPNGTPGGGGVIVDSAPEHIDIKLIDLNLANLSQTPVRSPVRPVGVNGLVQSEFGGIGRVPIKYLEKLRTKRYQNGALLRKTASPASAVVRFPG